MRYFLMIIMSLGLLGCTTTFEMQKDELKEAYDNGSLPAEEYHKQLEEINKEEAAYNLEQEKMLKDKDAAAEQETEIKK